MHSTYLSESEYAVQQLTPFATTRLCECNECTENKAPKSAGCRI